MRINLKGLFDRATSPKAFATYALFGVGATITMAILNTRKQCEHEYEKKSQGENLEKESTPEETAEEIRTVVRNYIPTIVTAIATVYCINKAETKWIDYTGVINSVATNTQNRLRTLRSTAPALAAAEVLKDFSHKKPEEGLQWFSVCGTADHIVYFQSTMADVIFAEYALNQRFSEGYGSVSVYDFFELLDILDQCREEYDKLGWTYEKMIEDWGGEVQWIHFKHSWIFDEEIGEKIVSVDYIDPPSFSDYCVSYSDPFFGGSMPLYNHPRE